MNYINMENIEIKSIYPGKDFDDLYNKLLEKKYVDKPLRYETSECSYGITIISDFPEIYCKYHGNLLNTNKYESLCSRIHFYKNQYGGGIGRLAFVFCLVLYFILIVKSITKKVIKRR